MLSLVLTSCLSPSLTLKLPHHDPNLRFKEVKSNLLSILSFTNDCDFISTVYLIDSSPQYIKLFDVFPDFENIYPKFIFIHFPIYDSFVLHKGKGYSELLMINHVLSTNCKSKYFAKLTSRYVITNLSQILDEFTDQPTNFVCQHNILRGLTHSYFFISRTNFWFKLQNSDHLSSINDNEKYYFEHALYDSLLEYTTSPFSRAPHLSIDSSSGQTGRPHIRTHDFFSLRSFLVNYVFNRNEKFIRKLAKIFRLLFIQWRI